MLEQQQLFNINAQPIELPAGEAEFIKRFGLPKSLQGFSNLAKLRMQWAAHRASWTAPAVALPAAAPAAGVKRKRGARDAGALPVVSQRNVWDYWAALAASAPELSRVALRSWLSPVSSTSVERIFSYLKALDSPSRRSMERTTLEMILFLRANWRIVELLRLDLADAFDTAEGPADRVGEGAAAIATAAQVALRSAHTAAAAEAALREEAMPAADAAAELADEEEGEDASD